MVVYFWGHVAPNVAQSWPQIGPKVDYDKYYRLPSLPRPLILPNYYDKYYHGEDYDKHDCMKSDPILLSEFLGNRAPHCCQHQLLAMQHGSASTA